MVNAERIPGGPLTLELRDVPEAEALDVLLRSLSGYFAAPRAAIGAADASVFESVVVMPTIAASAPRTAAAGSPAPPQFQPVPIINQNEDDQDNANVRPVGNPPPPGAQPVRPPIFSTFPAPQQGNPNNGAQPRPTLPSVRPGIVAQPQGNPGGDSPAPVPQPVAQPPAAPSSRPGAPIGVSAPGMVAPAAPPQPTVPRTLPTQE
jgi:hypothetical protein